MRHKKTWAIATSILLATCALTSCSSSRSLNAFFGEERYLPDDANVNFGTPRRPILNPLNNYPPEDQGAGNTQDSPRAFTAMNSEATGNGKRRVPSENLAILTGKSSPEPVVAKAEAAPVTSVDTALNDALTRPAAAPEAPKAAAVASSEMPAATLGEPVTLMQPMSERPAGAVESVATPAAQETQAVASTAPALDWSAPQEPEAQPSAPASATPATEAAPAMLRLTPPAAPKPGEEASLATVTPQVAATPAEIAQPAVMAQESESAQPEEATTPASVAQTPVLTRPATEVAASETATDHEYPSLSSIPEAPAATPSEKIASDMQSLEQDKSNTDTAGKVLLNDPGATAMTSPQTGELVANAATAMPALQPAAGKAMPAEEPKADNSAKSEGETAWLNNLLGSKEQSAAEPVQASEAPAEDLTAPPALAEGSAPNPMGTAAAVEQLTPPSAPKTTASEASAVVAAANASQTTAAIEAAPAAGSADAPAGDTVKLTPPVNVGEAIAVKADQQLADIVEQPVEDTQPAVKKAVQYLPENRYAKRRLAPVNEAY